MKKLILLFLLLPVFALAKEEPKDSVKTNDVLYNCSIVTAETSPFSQFVFLTGTKGKKINIIDNNNFFSCIYGKDSKIETEDSIVIFVPTKTVLSITITYGNNVIGGNIFCSNSFPQLIKFEFKTYSETAKR